jgi:hypothetical protein
MNYDVVYLIGLWLRISQPKATFLASPSQVVAHLDMPKGRVLVVLEIEGNEFRFKCGESARVEHYNNVLDLLKRVEEVWS